MNNYKQGSAAKGKELFIANYQVRQNKKKFSNATQQLSLSILYSLFSYLSELTKRFFKDSARRFAVLLLGSYCKAVS
jgi:hypothetical protein